jgi:hypothetical protein
MNPYSDYPSWTNLHLGGEISQEGKKGMMHEEDQNTLHIYIYT